MHVYGASTTDNSNASKPPKQLTVSADTMSENLLNKVIPVYPDEAKKARIQGIVVLDAMIGKDGKVENLRVVSGPNQLQQSALDAVRQWTYRPYLLNGDPIEVKTTVNVAYSLAK
jgi:TonB family protein